MDIIDTEIIYWSEQIGFEIVKTEEYLEYVKEKYVKNEYDVVQEFLEVMEIKINTKYLNFEKICEDDDDYEHLVGNMYLNVYRLEDDEVELKRLDLIV